MDIVGKVPRSPPPNCVNILFRCLATVLCISSNKTPKSQKSSKEDINNYVTLDDVRCENNSDAMESPSHASDGIASDIKYIDEMNDNEQSDVVSFLHSFAAEIVSYLRVLRSAALRKAEEESLKEQWLLIANVIDRLLFWFFLAIDAALLGLLFGYRPQQEA